MIPDPGDARPEGAQEGDAAFTQPGEAWDIYRLLVENSYDLVGELDEKGEFVYVNPSYLRSLGYSARELLHKPALEFIHPQDVEKTKRELQQLDGTTIIRFRHQNDTWKWFDCSFRQFKTPGGSRTVLISRDFSARKEAEIKFDILASLGTRLSSARTQLDAARVIADASKTLCDWEAFNLDLYRNEEDAIYPVLMIDEIDGKPAEIPADLESRSPSPIVATIIRNGPQRILRKGNVFEAGLRPFGDKSHASASLMFVPICEGGEILGIISIQSYRMNAYTRSDLKLLQVLASHCSGTLARIRAVDDLRASQARFEAFMENTPGAAWIKDTKDRYVYANAAIEALLHRNRTEILRKTDAELFDESIAQVLQAADQVVRDSGEPFSVQGRVSPTDPGNWFVCRFPFSSPEAVFVGGVAFDISEQAELQKSLDASERRFRILIESSPVGIALLRAGTIIFANRAYRQIFQVQEEAIKKGRTFLDDLAPAACGEVSAFLKLPATAPASFPASEIMCVRGKSQFPCIIQIAPAEIPEGHSHVVFILDISEKRSLELQLIQAQKMESIGRLAGGVANEFANLLTVIHGQASRLERGYTNPASSLDAIIRAAHKANELTRQLLAFSRKQTVRMKQADLNELVTRTAKLIEPMLNADITLRLHLWPGTLPINADEYLLGQLLVNLAATAHEGMPTGGNLAITTFWTERKSSGDAGSILLRVEDTGRGFRPEDLPHIFEPFFQTSAGTEVALRLATVYGIVNQHDAKIEVESHYGSGTRFTLEFLAAAAPIMAAPAVLPARTPLTILVVEDSNDLRVLLRELLIEFGYAVIEASSFSEGFQLFAANRDTVSLVIADVFLDDGSGRELVRQLRAQKAGLRAIITTGYDPHQTREKLELQKDELFLGKPFQIDELLAAIKTLLEE